MGRDFKLNQSDSTLPGLLHIWQTWTDGTHPIYLAFASSVSLDGMHHLIFTGGDEQLQSSCMSVSTSYPMGIANVVLFRS